MRLSPEISDVLYRLHVSTTLQSIRARLVVAMVGPEERREDGLQKLLTFIDKSLVDLAALHATSAAEALPPEQSTATG